MSLDIWELIERGEGQHVEFKASFSEENEAIEALGAFANAEGGTVLVGASDTGVIMGHL
ncbi:MAG: ATP-binding protein [Dehalococcoidia bacterium]|nr:ATP-binding protein [Dehalococcoidia bacterium]